MEQDAILEEKKQAVAKLFKEEIDRRVIERVNALQMNPIQKIDTAQIEKECRQALIAEMTEQLREEMSKAQEFKDLLHQDDPKFYEEFIARNPDPEKDARPHHTQEEVKKLATLGQKWLDENDNNKALLYFGYLTLAEPESADMWLLRGMTEQNLRKYDDALRSYMTALVFDAKNLVTYISLMNCLILADRIDQAKQIYDDLYRQIDPSHFTNGKDPAKQLAIIKQYITGEVVIKR